MAVVATVAPPKAKGGGMAGTEPVVRVTVEANDADLMQSVLDRLSAVVKASV